MATTKISVQQISEKLFNLVGKNYLYTDKSNVTFDGVETEVERTKLTNTDGSVPSWEEVSRTAIVFITDNVKNTIVAVSKVTDKNETDDKIKVVVDSNTSEIQAQIDDIIDRLDTDEDNISTNADDIDALEGRMDTAESDIDALEGRMDTAEANIATNTSDIATNATNIATNTSDIADLRDDLDALDTDLDDLVDRVDQHDLDIADRVTKTEAAPFVKDIAYDSATCTFTFTMYDGSTQDVDLPLESTVKDGRYDETDKKLILVLNDPSETEIEIPVEDLCDVYTGNDGSIIKVEVSSANVISATIKAGTITENELHQDIKDRFDGWDDAIDDLQDQIDAIDPSVAAKISDIKLVPNGTKVTFDLGVELSTDIKTYLWFNGVREVEGSGYSLTRVDGSHTTLTTLFDDPAATGDSLYVEVIR